jgi:hypothetical protein
METRLEILEERVRHGEFLVMRQQEILFHLELGNLEGASLARELLDRFVAIQAVQAEYLKDLRQRAGPTN